MAAVAMPQRRQRLTELAGKPRALGQLGQKPGTGVADHTLPPAGDGDLRTGGNLHLESAFRDGRSGP